MAVSDFDLDHYSELLSEAHPRVPQTEEDNDTLLEKARELQRKDQISLEEQALVDVLLVLIERFEEEHYGSKKAQPDAVLRELMRARDLKPKDLYNIFGGSKGTTSEV